MDSLIVTIALQHLSITPNWKISSTILEILASMSTSSSGKACKVNKRVNFCAHNATNWVVIRKSFGCIPLSLSLSLSLSLQEKWSSATNFLATTHKSSLIISYQRQHFGVVANVIKVSTLAKTILSSLICRH